MPAIEIITSHVSEYGNYKHGECVCEGNEYQIGEWVGKNSIRLSFNAYVHIVGVFTSQGKSYFVERVHMISRRDYAENKQWLHENIDDLIEYNQEIHIGSELITN